MSSIGKYLTMLIVLVLNDTLVSQTLVPYKYLGAAAVGRSIGDGLANSLNAFGDLVKEIREFEAQLQEARRQYWEKYNVEDPYSPTFKANVPKDIEIKYLDLLQQKDMYYLSLDFYNYIKSNNGGQSSLRGLGDVVDLLTGKMDGGINSSALLKYEIWSKEVFSAWGKSISGGSFFDAKNFEIAFKDNMELYNDYVSERNSSEYYYKNPYSPLKSKNSKTYFIANSILFDLYEDNDRIIQDYNLIVAEAIKENLDIAFENLRRSSTKSDDDRLMEFNWAIAKSSKSLLGLYMIKRKFKCTWAKAKQIYNYRVKRYGKNKIDEIVNTLWANKDNIDFQYPVNPAFFNLYDRGNRYKNIFNRNEDCMASHLGPNTLWLDYLDLAKNEMNGTQVKNGLFNNLENADDYKNLVELFPEDVLLTAFYIEKEYGLNLYLSDHNPDIHHIQKHIASYNKSDFIYKLLIGLSIAKKDCYALSALALLPNVKENRSWVSKLGASVKKVKNKIAENTLDCKYIISIAQFDDAINSMLNECVMHSQSIVKLCLGNLEMALETPDEKKERTRAITQKSLRFRPSIFKLDNYLNYRTHNYTDSNVAAPNPNFSDCPVNKHSKKQLVEYRGAQKLINNCFMEGFTRQLKLLLKNELIALGAENEIHEYKKRLHATIVFAPDGALVLKYIETAEPTMLLAVNNSLEKLPHYGPFTLWNKDNDPVMVSYMLDLVNVLID